jgi:hypothetical protein
MNKLKSTSKTNPNSMYDGVSFSFSATVTTDPLRRDNDDAAEVVAHIEPVWNQAIAMINQAIEDCLQSDFLPSKVEAAK